MARNVFNQQRQMGPISPLTVCLFRLSNLAIFLGVVAATYLIVVLVGRFWRPSARHLE